MFIYLVLKSLRILTRQFTRSLFGLENTAFCSLYAIFARKIDNICEKTYHYHNKIICIPHCYISQLHDFVFFLLFNPIYLNYTFIFSTFHSFLLDFRSSTLSTSKNTTKFESLSEFAKIVFSRRLTVFSTFGCRVWLLLSTIWSSTNFSAHFRLHTTGLLLGWWSYLRGKPNGSRGYKSHLFICV